MKLIESNKENYYFEEQQGMKICGGLHERIDSILHKNSWKDLTSEDVMTMIKLHEHLDEYTTLIDKLTTKRENLSRNLVEMI
jgi:hypothetical protein